MQGTIVDFVHALRKAQVPVSIAETVDALRAVTHVPVSEREAFKEALRATLIKSQRHSAAFDRLFPMFFDTLLSIDSSTGHDLAEEGVICRQDILQLFFQGTISASPLAQALMGGDMLALEGEALRAASSAGLERIRYPIQAGFFSRRLLEQFNWQQLEEQLGQVMQQLEDLGWQGHQLMDLRRTFHSNVEVFRGLLRRVVEREIQRQGKSWSLELASHALQGKSLSSLSEDEVRQMQQEVNRLAQLLKTKLSIRRKQMLKGRLDLRKTLRRNIQLGGVPMHLVRARRKVKKAQVMALCDVSSSVWNASRFMLTLLYAIQDQFSKVRSFVFVSELGEVTDFFTRYDPNEAVQKALKEAGINYFSYTDYGEVFKLFHDSCLGEINRRTIVIVIGDGRNNYLPTNNWALEEIYRKSNKVIWLNPEHRSMWNTGDSVMEEYRRFCHIVRECRTLAHLRTFVWELAHLIPL